VDNFGLREKKHGEIRKCHPVNDGAGGGKREGWDETETPTTVTREETLKRVTGVWARKLKRQFISFVMGSEDKGDRGQ